MIHKKFVKQLIAFHKTSFENCFSMMIMLQQQAENIFNFFYYLPIMNDNGKKLMQQHTDNYKKWIDDLKKAMDDGYAKIESLYDDESMAALHEQAKKLFHSHLNEAGWMPENLKQTLEQMDSMYKKGCDEFQKYVNENIRSIGKAQKQRTKTRKKTESD
jgi:predicted glycoside hydrolase/deacetylase ChbG (UPF0249 family)